MPGPAFREGERVALCPVEPADYDFLVEHGNRRDVRLMTDTTEPFSHDDLREILESDDSIQFLLCADGEPVGTMWLFAETARHGRAELGYWIAEEARGQGYATEGVELTCEYVAEERRLRKLLARVFEGNEASARVLEKVGFEREGVLRDHYYVDGEYLDATLFGWLAD